MSKHVGKVFPTNKCGNLEVVEYYGATEAVVRFCDTGFETTASIGNIMRGKVKDPLSPSVHGVGFIGVGDHKVSISGEHTKAYQVWHSMLARCYSCVKQEIQPTYRGCTVHKDWHNFQAFAKWYYGNYPSDGGNYQLDKDIKIKGNKVYSADTCLFVTLKENSVKANAKTYIFINPDGGKVEIYNLNEFCRGNDLNHGAMCQVHSGNQKSHKGWKV